MLVYAIDPGTTQSAIVGWDGTRVVWFKTLPNEALLHALLSGDDAVGMPGATLSASGPSLVIETIASYGMPVGKEVFETCFWTGRFYQAWPWAGRAYQLERKAVKLHLCGSPRATDANIRAAILDRFGPGKTKAVGVKSAQGPLYGMKGHEYAALAVALTFRDTHGDAK